MRPKARPKTLRVKVFDRNYGCTELRMYGITDIRNDRNYRRGARNVTEVREIEKNVQTYRRYEKISSSSETVEPRKPVETLRLSGPQKSGPA